MGIENHVNDNLKELFDIVYRTNQLDTGNEFPERDAQALALLVRTILKERIMVLEIGSWKGRSTIILAGTVHPHDGQIFAIDTWMGSPGVPHHECAKEIDIFSIFKRNLKALGLERVVHPLVMDSFIASKIFAYNVLDLIFIDGDHRYERVMQDISTWLPKLRYGGILCGHDCEGYYGQYPERIKDLIGQHIGEDYIPNIDHPQADPGVHPGVVKAVYDHFGTNFGIMPNSTIWYYVKKLEGRQPSF
jgi:predicted O-methyltransferase YrrM